MAKGGQDAAEQSSGPSLEAALQHHQAGRFSEAAAIYQDVLQTDPSHADALHLLGLIALQVGQNATAADLIGRAIAASPTNPVYFSSLGSVRKAQGNLDAAVESYRKALALKPDFSEAHYNLGLVFQSQEKHAAAIEHYRNALAINPDYADAYGNLGAVYHLQGRMDEAIECYQKAISIRPDAVAHNNLSMVLKGQYRFLDSLRHALRAVELNPGLAAAHQSLAMMLGHLSDFSGVTEHSDAALALGGDDDRDLWESRLYIYSYHPDLSAEDIYAEFVRWGDRFPPPPANRFAEWDRNPERRLRVGYVSPDFRQHTSRFMFEALFAAHDRSQIELVAYSNVKAEDAFTERFKELFDQWRNIRGMSDAEAADMVRSDRIDILVDGCNHMTDDRLGVFALKPAPIQVTWLGSSWTSGLPTMDYVLFDKYMAPEGTLAREKIVRIPCVGAFHELDPGDIGPPPVLKNGYITFGYSGRTERLNHRVFRAWAEILQRLPEARLILDFMPFDDPATREYYAMLLEKHGVDVGRVIMRRSMNIFEGLGDFDILLDSFPHSGGTMLADAAWMGVPLLTLAARPPVGRIGTAVLSHIGLENWIAHDEAEYVDKAVAFARDVEYLKTLRPTMRDRLRRSPLMDKEAFARSLDAAYRAMWRRWCSGLLPCDFDVGGESAAA